MIEQRISALSSNEQVFESEKGIYEKALEDSGYNYKMKYVTNESNPTRRKRKIYWFNPPFSKTVKTNVGKFF